MDFVELVFRFVPFFGNGEHAEAMNGGGRRAEPGDREAQMVPTQVHSVDDEEESGETGDQTREKAYGGRGLRLRGHGDCLCVVFCLGRSL